MSAPPAALKSSRVIELSPLKNFMWASETSRKSECRFPVEKEKRERSTAGLNLKVLGMPGQSRVAPAKLPSSLPPRARATLSILLLSAKRRTMMEA